MPLPSLDTWPDALLPIAIQPRLSDYTTLRCGGVVPLMVFCRRSDELRRAVAYCVREKWPFVVMGAGSNVLCSDEGAHVIVVRYLTDQCDVMDLGDGLFHVSGASSLDEIVSWSVSRGWAGLQEFSGIPGTVGGAVVGNAGAFGRAIGDVVVQATVLDRQGRETVKNHDELGFAYRHSRLKETNEILLDVTIRLSRQDPALLAQRRRDILALRREKHPDPAVLPTAGSFFRNLSPTSAAQRRQAAGFFLEQAGAKGLSVGKARVYEKHANIIVAEPGARATDVYRLAMMMHELCLKRFGIDLVREVRLLGRFFGRGRPDGWW